MFLPQQDGALHIFAALLFQPGKRHFPPSHPLPHPGSSRASDAVLSAPASGRYVPDHLSFVRTSHALGPFGYVLAPSETGSIALRPCHIFIPAWQASFPVPAAAQLQRNKQSHSVTLPPPWFGRASVIFHPLLRTGSSEVRQCCFSSRFRQEHAPVLPLVILFLPSEANGIALHFMRRSSSEKLFWALAMFLLRRCERCPCALASKHIQASSIFQAVRLCAFPIRFSSADGVVSHSSLPVLHRMRPDAFAPSPVLLCALRAFGRCPKEKRPRRCSREATQAVSRRACNGSLPQTEEAAFGRRCFFAILPLPRETDTACGFTLRGRRNALKRKIAHEFH